MRYKRQAKPYKRKLSTSAIRDKLRVATQECKINSQILKRTNSTNKDKNTTTLQY